MITKKELVATAASAVGITQKDCAAVVDAFIDAALEAVGRGTDEVSIGDLGKFKIAETKATAERTMTSGLTGKEVVIPAKEAGIKATFKIGKKVKEAVASK